MSVANNPRLDEIPNDEVGIQLADLQWRTSGWIRVES